MKNSILLIYLLVGFLNAQTSELFDQGNALYNEGKYSEAISKYEQIMEREVHSSELYFNLGNAHYKLNNIGPSIYYFEKALQLKPKDPEIENNLNYAKKMTIDAVDSVPEIGFTRFTKNFVNALSSDGWAIIAVTSAFVFVLLFITYRFSYASTYKRVAFIISVLALLILGVSLFTAFQKERLDVKNRPAIVFAQESRVKAEPNLRSEEAFRLHEGTKVQVLDTLNEWKKIKLSDGSTGWIPSEDIKLLSAF